MSGQEGARTAARPLRWERAEPATTGDKAGLANGAATKEYRMATEVTLRDADKEVSLTLASLAYAYERREVDAAVTYLIRRRSTALGRLVLAPPTRVFPFVRVREVHLCPEFAALCQAIRRDLKVLSWAAQQAGVEESSRYSYPRPQRRQIVAEYRAARRNGEVECKQTWADSRYHISRKTLWRYECEFPEGILPSTDRPPDD